MNTVCLIGRIGRDPEMRHTQSGTAVCTLSLAVDDGWGDNKKTYWFDVVCWKEAAERAAQHLAKGARVAVTGRLTQREWEKDGQKRRIVEIVASSVDYLDRKASGGRRDAGEDESEVPF